MGMHRYIGARYVPYYYENSLDPTSTEWEPNVTYEALTVVTLPNQHSYISKKAVPDTVGSPAQNADYWLDTGSNDAYIQNLQDQIDQINNDLVDINDEIDIILSGANRKIVFVTDSYGTHSVTNWAQRTATMLGIAAGDYYIFAEGSSGFDHAGSAGHTFQTLLAANIGNISNPDEITDVVFGGGTNDFYYFQSEASLTAAIDSAIAYVRTVLPNAVIWSAFMGYYVRMDTTTMRGAYKDTIKIYESAFLKNTCKFINAYAPMHSYYCRSDSQHPNETGNAEIAQIVAAGLLGCGRPLYFDKQKFNSTITPPSGTTSGLCALSMQVAGDEAIIKLNRYTWSETISLAPNSNLTLGLYDNDAFPIIYLDDFWTTIPVLVQVSGSWRLTAARVAFIMSTTPGKGTLILNGMETISGITAITLPDFDVTVPLVYA